MTTPAPATNAADKELVENLVVRGLHARALWVKWLLGGTAALLAILAPMELSLLDADLQTLEITESLYVILIVLTIASGVAFITWSFRAHSNLRLLGRQDVRHHDQATIWWWIVPIAFLFMPFRVMYETVRGSLRPMSDPQWRHGSLDPAAIWWTILWLSGLLTARISAVTADQASSLERLELAFQVSAMSSAMLAGAAVACIVMVTRVTDGQRQMLASPFSTGASSSHQESPVTSTKEEASSQRVALSTPPTHEGTLSNEHAPAKHCTGCGRGYDEGDRFCAGCGRERPQ